MNKTDIVQQVKEAIESKRHEIIPTSLCSEIISSTFDYIVSTLNKGESVKIKYFGTFVIKKRAKHKGVNPQTGEPIEIPEKKHIVLKPSKKLKQALE